MAKPKKFELEDPAPILDDEDEETLAAIDEGIRDAETGRVVPAEKARELLPKWNRREQRHSAVGFAAMMDATHLDDVGIRADKQEAVVANAKP
jgi:hypothetical protein